MLDNFLKLYLIISNDAYSSLFFIVYVKQNLISQESCNSKKVRMAKVFNYRLESYKSLDHGSCSPRKDFPFECQIKLICDLNQYVKSIDINGIFLTMSANTFLILNMHSYIGLGHGGLRI